MATAVGALSIDLSLNSAAFIRDAGKSQKALASNSARMNKSLARLDKGFNRVLRSSKATAKNMISMRGVMAGVAGAAGIGLLVKKSLDFADAIGKTADAIGISTGALQEYRFALDLAGVSTETTDKGLTKFVRNMGELGRTSSETQTALKDLDPALLQNLRSLKTVEDQLAAGFRALAGYTNQQQRAAVAAALFGRAGVKMTVAVKNGIAAFERLRQRGVDLGIILEEKLIRNAEKAKDELTVLAQVIKIKAIGAVIAFAPEIINLATAFSEGIPKIIAWVEAFGRFIGLIDKTRVGNLTDIAKEMAEIRREFDQLNDLMADPAFIPTGRQLARMDELLARLKLLRAAQSDLARESTVALPKPGAPSPTPGLPAIRPNKFRPAHPDADFLAGAEQAARVRRDAITAEGAIAEATRKTTEEMTRQANQTLVLTTATMQGAAALRAQEEIFELQNAALAQGIDLTTEQGQAWEAAFRQVQIFNNGLEETRTEMEAAREEAERMADVLTGVVDQALQGNIRSWKDLGRVAIGVIQDILREQLRAAVKAQAMGGGGFFGSLFGGGGGGGGGGAAAGVGAATFSDFNSVGFAHGGTATVGGSGGTDSKLAVLKVSPREDITVRTPAQQKAARGGGFTFNDNSVITIDARGADAGVDRKIRDAMERTQAATVAKVRDLVARGGRYSSSFGV